MAQYLFLFLIATVATFLQTSVGFGFSVFAMIFLPALYPYGTAVAICQAIAVVNTIYLSIRYWRHIQWRTMIPLLIPTLLFGILFTVFSFSIETHYLKAMLGILLIILSIYFFRFSQRIKIRPKVGNGIVMGTISGIGNGLFGIGGPPAALYLLPAVEDKTEYLATVQAYFTFCNITNLITRIIKGAFQASYLPHIAIGWLGVVAGTIIGLYAFKRLNSEMLKKLVYAFVGLNGLWIVIQELIL